MPSASAGTAFSASSEEVEGSVANTEKATGPLASNDEEASSKAEPQFVDKESLKQAYARLQSLLQQDIDLADKPVDAIANYRQARLEAESLEQRILATLASQTATAEEVSQLQAQLAASSNKLEASITGLQVAVKPVVPAPVVGEESREKAETFSASRPVEAAPAPAEKAIARITETNLATDADKPATDQNPAVKPDLDLTTQAAPSIAEEKKAELDKIRAVADAVEKIEEAQAKAIDYTVVYLDKQTGLEVWREKKSYTPVTKENELDKDATITVKPEISNIKELEGYRIEGEQEKSLTLSPSKDNVIDFAVAAAGSSRQVREASNLEHLYSGKVINLFYNPVTDQTEWRIKGKGYVETPFKDHRKIVERNKPQFALSYKRNSNDPLPNFNLVDDGKHVLRIREKNLNFHFLIVKDIT